jgi:hypothetical protein
MRLSLVLVTLLVAIPVVASSEELFSVEDGSLAQLPKQISDAIYQADSKNLTDFVRPQNGRCNLIGMRIKFGQDAKPAYFATTANACNWGAAIGPIYLVLAEPHPTVILSDGGQAIGVDKESHNGLPDLVISASAANWSQKSWWKFNGAKYVKDKEEICSGSPDEGVTLQCKTIKK